MLVSLEAHASRPARGTLRALATNRRGAALPEYALLLGLFLVVVVGLLTGMGSHLRSIFGKANTELQSGDCAATGNCSVATVPSASGGSGSSSGSGGSGGSGISSGGSSSPSDGGASGSGGASGGGGGTATPPDQAAADQSSGSSGGGAGGSEPGPTLDIYPR
jgi:type IV secretion system protein TrbL